MIVADAAVDLNQAYRRSMCVSTPLLEALAEGKLGKAEALLEAGANPCVQVGTFAEPSTRSIAVRPFGARRASANVRAALPNHRSCSCLLASRHKSWTCRNRCQKSRRSTSGSSKRLGSTFGASWR